MLNEESKPCIVEECYAAWNRRDMSAAVDCFADSFEYEDSQYLGTFTNKNALQRHFSQGAAFLPSNSQLIVDNVAVCSLSGNIGTRWHVEQSDGSIVSFTRGCSFYTTSSNGLITSGFRVSEMLVKPNKEIVDGMVSSASKVLQNVEGKEPPLASQSDDSGASSSSIIEKYFEAWNKRDMESALECFVEDCTYQTEDPVFVDTFEGKASLREHLVKNAAALPSSCRILLDDLAIDPTNGNIGTRWHLEVNGWAIPNLRGCSMYTTDPATGLLKSGFDVTESPVKLPRMALPGLSLPAKVFWVF
jgi:ketosteroid isomerase-like protein